MTIFEKIAQARELFVQANVKPTGDGMGGRFKYFDLADILPAVTPINKQVGILPVCSFTADLATLTVYDTETGDRVELTSPMSAAKLSGCHEVQNLGAVETYIKRYLYQNLYDVVENDALDGQAGNGQDAKQKQSKPAEPTPPNEPVIPRKQQVARHLRNNNGVYTKDDVAAFMSNHNKQSFEDLTKAEFDKLITLCKDGPV